MTESPTAESPTTGPAPTEPPPAEPGSELGGVLSAELAAWPVEAAAAVTDGRATLAASGPVDRVWPWASVTKLLTALATLVAVEEGTVELDQPAGPPGSTLRHLLAHASGLGPDGGVLAPPGTRRIYSNGGFDLIGATVAHAAGMPFDEYLAAGVLGPLGLDATTFEGSPASGAAGPLRDLVRLAEELLRPSLVSAGTALSATSVAFPRLDGVLPGYGRQSPNDWGLGFEIRGTKRPHWTGEQNSPATFGHFGRSGSFIWVDPAVGLACVELADQPWGPWAVPRWPALSDAVLATVTGERGAETVPYTDP